MNEPGDPELRGSMPPYHHGKKIKRNGYSVGPFPPLTISDRSTACLVWDLSLLHTG